MPEMQLARSCKPRHGVQASYRTGNEPQGYSVMTVITVGAAQIRRVEEMTINSSIATLTRDEALIAANRHWLGPHFLDPQDRAIHRHRHQAGGC